jgi:acrylyl-CoA reductase (NADPH)
MTTESFKALVLNEQAGEVQSSIQTLSKDDLPEGDVLVSVAYSGLNYKDGLALTGKGKIVRSYPMVPGIDFSGTVVESASPDYKPGDRVVLTGWGVGERYWGGYEQLARVRSEWLVPLPEGLDLQQVMSIGTAGLTAMLCVLALEEHGLVPTMERELLVTGAGGGVGGVAVAVLANLGYKVVAATGRTETHAYLKELGAHDILDRNVLSAAGKPMEKERWDAAVDTVGGDTLAGVIRSMAYNSSIAACGNAGGITLNTTVLPFILRGVNLLGVESVVCPKPRRQEAWSRLARDLPRSAFEPMTQVVKLEDVPAYGRQILEGQVRGRIVVDLQA